MGDALNLWLMDEAHRPVTPRVARMAEAIVARHGGALAVIYYGSTLRAGRVRSEMLDFYLVVDSYAGAYGSRALAAVNRLVPPNVFPFSAEGLVAKYAVLDRRDLSRLVTRAARDVSVWARFAQPVRLVWCRDEAAAREVVAATRASVLTLLRSAAPMEPTGDPVAIWRTGLALTYGAELRAERHGRGDGVIDHDPDRYRRTAMLAADRLGWPVETGRIARRWTAAERAAEARLWRMRRWRGKALTLLRLVKASTTYGGGIDYLADKIERHSGHPVRLKPWQRRAPLLGALWLLPSLIRAGAVR